MNELTQLRDVDGHHQDSLLQNSAKHALHIVLPKSLIDDGLHPIMYHHDEL